MKPVDEEIQQLIDDEIEQAIKRERIRCVRIFDKYQFKDRLDWRKVKEEIANPFECIR